MQCSLCNRLPGTNEANLVIHHKSSHIMKRQVNKIMLSFGGMESKIQHKETAMNQVFPRWKTKRFWTRHRGFVYFSYFQVRLVLFTNVILYLLMFSKRSTQFDKWETSCIITELNLFTTKQIQQKRKVSVSFTSSIVFMKKDKVKVNNICR